MPEITKRHRCKTIARDIDDLELELERTIKQQHRFYKILKHNNIDDYLMSKILSSLQDAIDANKRTIHKMREHYPKWLPE